MKAEVRSTNLNIQLSSFEEKSEPERRELSTVAESVEKHMADRGFNQRAEHLADDIVRADQQMESHLQKAFGHRVGTLGDTTAAKAVT